MTRGCCVAPFPRPVRASFQLASVIPSIIVPCIILSQSSLIDLILLAMIDLKNSPRISKGRSRLADIKATAVRANSDHRQRQLALGAGKRLPTSNRGESLRERLKAKQDLKSSLPAPPSKAEAERQAALQRVPDVVPILSLSGARGTRSTQPLASLVQSIQNSARSPVAKDEVERCLDVVAQWIAPEFLQIEETGGVTAAIINHARRPSDIDARIKAAIAG